MSQVGRLNSVTRLMIFVVVATGCSGSTSHTEEGVVIETLTMKKDALLALHGSRPISVDYPGNYYLGHRDGWDYIQEGGQKRVFRFKHGLITEQELQTQLNMQAAEMRAFRSRIDADTPFKNEYRNPALERWKQTRNF